MNNEAEKKSIQSYQEQCGHERKGCSNKGPRATRQQYQGST
jgi:hypothetical protein